MSNNLSWRDALKQFNDKRVQEGGKYTIPKKGTPEYASVRELMGEKSDAVPLKPNQTVTGQTPPGKSTGKPRSRTPKTKRTDSEEKIHKAVQALVPTKVDEPKPKKGKKPKMQEFEPDENGKMVLVRETHKPPTNTPEEINKNIKKHKPKNKKNVATQTEAPSSPKSDDFIVKLK